MEEVNASSKHFKVNLYNFNTNANTFNTRNNTNIRILRLHDIVLYIKHNNPTLCHGCQSTYNILIKLSVHFRKNNIFNMNKTYVMAFDELANSLNHCLVGSKNYSKQIYLVKLKNFLKTMFIDDVIGIIVGFL